MRLLAFTAFVLLLSSDIGHAPEPKRELLESKRELPPVKDGEKRVFLDGYHVDFTPAGKLTEEQKKMLDELANPPKKEVNYDGHF